MQPRDDPGSAAAIFEHETALPAEEHGGVLPTVQDLERPHALGGDKAPLVEPMHLQDSLAAAINAPLEIPGEAATGDQEPGAGAADPVAWIDIGALEKKHRENPFASRHAPGRAHLHELAERLQSLASKHHLRQDQGLQKEKQLVDSDFKSYFPAPQRDPDSALERRFAAEGRGA